MNVREITQILEEQSPLSYALEWDNVGLLAGDLDREVNKIYIALDASDAAVDAAVEAGADMLLTHHPLIFKGIKKIVSKDFTGRRLIKLISNHIAYYAMHTNFDVRGMADLSAAMLGLENTEVLDVTAVTDGREEGIGRTGTLMQPMSLEYCAEFVKAAFSLKQVTVFGEKNRLIKKAAISPGSGKSEIANAISRQADVLITGDIGYHDGIDAAAAGLCIIDAGHYGLEHIFIRYMKEYLEKHCEGVSILAQEISFPCFIV